MASISEIGEPASTGMAHGEIAEEPTGGIELVRQVELDPSSAERICGVDRAVVSLGTPVWEPAPAVNEARIGQPIIPLSMAERIRSNDER